MTDTATDTTPPVAPIVERDDGDWFVVDDVDAMAPFLMSVISDGDRWMFISSTGVPTAGRRNADHALFRYETDDRLHESVGWSGPVTRLRLAGHRWAPFGASVDAAVERRLLKSTRGDAVEFDERHVATGMRFTSRWQSCDEAGFVRTCTLTNEGSSDRSVELLDGLVGIVPSGLDAVTNQRRSNLANAYKRNEVVDEAHRVAVYSLESPVSDQAEPEEVLRASVVWSHGLADARLAVDRTALVDWERGDEMAPVRRSLGRPGAYLLSAGLEVPAGASVSWRIVADVGYDHVALVDLVHRLARLDDADGDHVGAPDDDRVGGVDAWLDAAIAASAARLDEIVAGADGLQHTADPLATAHHRSDVTYNVMRGGVPLHGSTIHARDVVSFVSVRHRGVADRHAELMRSWPASMEHDELLRSAAATGDPDLVRLAREFVPFSFSRRHGDPSRPWNAFSINVADEQGEPVVSFEGNWRDVFQNWEALCHSYPQYLMSVVTIFLDASTADGHNPYRITSHGFDWEVLDPDDPWSNIGYWGDHQLVYLLRLLQAVERFRPGTLASEIAEARYTFADVPYRIADYDELIADPKSTIRFDDEAAERAALRVAEIGADGKLVVGADGEIVRVSLIDKLLVAALAKLGNYVPGGGIWMNTQRPEWNDANNALVGYGVSTVTLVHLRQYVAFLRGLLGDADELEVSASLAGWMASTTEVLRRHAPGSAVADDATRRAVTDALGRLAADHRTALYRDGWRTDRIATSAEELTAWCDVVLAHLDATIAGARRDDGLFDAYLLADFGDPGRISLRRLPPMLEGQVAALGPGVMSPAAQADLLDAMFDSALYCPRRRSFMLAPEIELPSFLDKNVLTAERIARHPLLAALVEAGDATIVRVDADGIGRFDADLVDVDALSAALDRLAADDRWAALVAEHRSDTVDAYDEVFGHRSFLGRSASMYAYEGIGSIYWHMVTKLLLAVQEAGLAARDAGADPAIVGRLVEAYERVRAGLGYNRTAADFGAISIEPYSHTPSHAGAQQPGMTGAVKEEILTRPAELGLRVVAGEIVTDPTFLRSGELLDAPASWRGVDLGSGELALTVCGVPVVVERSATPGFVVTTHDGARRERLGERLDRADSAAVFARDGSIASIRVRLAP